MNTLRRWVLSLAFIILIGCLPTFCADYQVLVIPDNIVSNKSIKAMIYEDSSEFFAGEVINALNKTKYIKAPTVSEVRAKIKTNSRLTQSTNNSMKEFREGYNVNYLNVKKLASYFGINHVLLITSSIDTKNYLLRRSVWDFLNIPGASVIDPAYRISTYAILIDAKNDVAVWSNTYYKTISIVESRMVTLDFANSTPQLEKIRDYSRTLAPNIAKNTQLCVLPSAITANKDNLIDDGFSQYDNNFTKKYRKYKKNTSILYNESKTNLNTKKEKRALKRAAKNAQKAEIKAQKEKIKAQNEEIKKSQPPKESLITKIKKRFQKTTPKKEAKPLTIQNTDSKNQGILDINNTIPKTEPELIPAVNTKTEPTINDVLKNDIPEYTPSKPRLREGTNSLETINDL